MALSPALTRIKNNQITDSTIVASSKVVIRSVTGGLLSDPLTYSGNVSITGNLIVQGTTTTVDTTNTVVADPLIALNRNQAGTPTYDQGLVFSRGTSPNMAFVWDETNTQFALVQTTETGSTAGTINKSAYVDLKTGNLIVANTSTYGNIQIGNNTIISTNTNGNINLTPNGTGQVKIANAIVSTLTNGRFVLTGSNSTLTEDANITYSGNSIIIGGNLTANGGVILTSAATGNIFDVTPATINMGGNASIVNIGKAAGVVNIAGNANISGGVLDTNTTTGNLFVANVTTLNVGSAATTVNIGAATGTTNVKNSLDVDANINMDGGNFTTSAATVNIANATTTTLNIGGAATTVNVGASSGNVRTLGDIIVGGNDIRESGGNVTISLNNLDTTLAGNLAVNGGDITTTQSTGNVFVANATTINFGNAATTMYLGSSSGNVITAGDLRINGNDIRSSTGNIAISLDNIDVTVFGNLTVKGAQTSVGSTDLVVEDSIINLHTQANLAPLTVDDGRDVGIKLHYYKISDKHAFVGWANDTGYLEYYSDATETGGVISGTYGSFKGATFISNVSTGTAPFSVISTTQVANLNVATAGSLVNGNSNVVVAANSNVSVSVAGNANVLVVTGTGANIGGTANITGNVSFGANLNTDAFTVNIANSTTTTLSIGGAATAVNIGASTGTTIIKNNLDVDGTINMDGANLTTSAATVNIANATTTTVNFAGAATTVNIGASTGTTNVKNSLDVDSNINMDGTNFTVTQSTVNIANANATTINFAGAATAINLGVSGGQTTLQGNLSVSNNFVVTANANLANLRVVDTTISSTSVNGNINLDPNGSGAVVLNSGGDNSNLVVQGNTTNGYSNTLFVHAANGSVGFRTNSIPAGAIVKFNSLDSFIIPTGATGDRPGTGVAGMVRFNTTINNLEFYDGAAWTNAGSSFTIIVADQFSGDGSTVAFTLSRSATSAGVIVAVNGVVQLPTTSYNVSTTTLTFTEAPQSGDVIDVRLILTTAAVTSIAEGDSSITVSDTGSNGNISLTADNTVRAYVNASVVGMNVPTLVTIANVSVGTSATTIDQWPMASYRSARYQIQVSHASAGYEVSEVLVVHNGTNATQTQFGVVYTGAASLGNVSVTTSAGNVLVQYTGANTSNTVRVAPTYIPV